MQLYVSFLVVLRGSDSQEHFLPFPAVVVRLPRQEALTGKSCRALQRHSPVFARVNGHQQNALEKWKYDVLKLFMRQLCSLLCERSYWVFFELHVTYCSYVLKIENEPNPLPGILEALAESPNGLLERAQTVQPPNTMAGGIVTWHALTETNK